MSGRRYHPSGAREAAVGVARNSVKAPDARMSEPEARQAYADAKAAKKAAKAREGVPRPDADGLARAAATKRARTSKPETLDRRAMQVLVDLIEAHAASGAPLHPANWEPLGSVIADVVFFRFAAARGLVDERRIEATIAQGADDEYAVEHAWRELAMFSNGEPIPYATLDAHWLGEVHSNFVRHRLGPDGRVENVERSTSHFTPRELSVPVVIRTLEPLLLNIKANGPVTAERILALRVCDPSAGGGAFLLSAADYLALALLDAWNEHGGAPAGVVDLKTCAQQLVAMHCLYGVDIDAGAVACCKRALWIHCRASNLPLSWLDDNIKVGDALVGLSIEQIARFAWKVDDELKRGPRLDEEVPEIRAKIDEAMRLGRDARKARLDDLTAIATRGAA